jgi:hypothetical protein
MVEQAMLPDNGKVLHGGPDPEKAPTVQRQTSKALLYGLPCASCRAYYAADQSECPVCKGTERVRPTSLSAVAVCASGPDYCGD